MQILTPCISQTKQHMFIETFLKRSNESPFSFRTVVGKHAVKLLVHVLFHNSK